MSKSTKSPAFQFYPKDWLSSRRIARMTPAEEGAYIRLLAYCWDSDDCSIPDDDAELAAMSRLGEEWFKGSSSTLRACFTPHPRKKFALTNKRLLTEKRKQSEWKRKCAAGGVKSGQQKRHRAKPNNENNKELKGTSRVGELNSKGSSRVVEVNSNSSSSSSSSFTSSSSSAGEREAKSAPAVGTSMKIPEGLIDHPAVIAYWERFRLIPAILAQERIEAAVGDDLTGWKEDLDYWQGNGHRPESVWKMIDRYEEQADERRRANGKNKPSIYDPAEQERLKSSGAHLYPDGFYRPY